MNCLGQYYLKVIDIIEKLYKRNEDCIKAADLLVKAVKEEKLVHVVGTEMHSSIAAQEIFFREGSLLNINPMFDPTFSVTHCASRSLYLKEADFCGEFLVEYYRNIHKGDVLIIIDTDGIGRACWEIVKKAKEMGLYIIAVTSRQFSKAVGKACEFRNKEKICLCEMEEIDVVIDNQVPAFDAVIEFESLGAKAGWISIIANSFIMNTILLSALEKIEKEMIKADIWNCFYDCEGLAENEKMIDKYYDKIKHI